jgi:hypothetical protein
MFASPSIRCALSAVGSTYCHDLQFALAGETDLKPKPSVTVTIFFCSPSLRQRRYRSLSERRRDSKSPVP